MIIDLKNGTASASVNTMGAELTSFKRADSFELLWQRDPKFWNGQAPVLFPVVGALRNNKAQIDGREYEIGKHGFARRKEFTVVSQTDERVELNLSSNAETRGMYPFDFSFTVVYSLGEKSLTTAFITKNIGERALPFCVGGHPAYNIPVAHGEKFEDYDIVFEKNEVQKCPEIDLEECLIDFTKVTLELKNENTIALQHDLFYRDALVFENLNSNKVSLKNRKSGVGVEMDFTGFAMLGIWSAANNGPYVALEPWTGCATTTEEDDVFEHKRHMIFLPAGEEKTFAFTTRYF